MYQFYAIMHVKLLSPLKYPKSNYAKDELENQAQEADG